MAHVRQATAKEAEAILERYPGLANQPLTVTILEEHGMSLRDWFAGQAMQGILSRGRELPDIKTLAGDSYNLADAMLEKRSQP